MLSGEFGSIPIGDVQDRPDGDVRPTNDDHVKDLSASIAKRGLIHPIVIDRDAFLVAGKHRLEACRALGWTHITFQYLEELDEASRLEIELEENIKRKDVDWKDQCRAMYKLHTLRVAQNGEAWTQEDTARESGWTAAFVGQRLAVAKEMIAGNARVLAAKEFSVAKGVTQRTQERKRADAIASIMETEADDLPPAPKDAAPILNTNFLEWVESYVGPPFNLIHCDFPYGLNADKFAQGASDSYGGYEDSFETYESLINCLEQNLEKLCGNSCHILFWFSMKYYQYTLDRLKNMGLWVDPYPLLWHKSDNKGTLPDPERGPRRVYEVAFICSRGDRKILSAVSNTISTPTVRLGEHMSEKSQVMLEHFMKMFVDADTRLLDPTCGSGSALRAAAKLGAGSVLGLEKIEEFAIAAIRAWEKRNVSS